MAYMDPTGFASAIGSLIGITGGLASYLKDVKDSQTDRDKFRLDCLATKKQLFALLKEFCQDHEDDEEWMKSVRELASPNGPFDALRESLQEIEKNLPKKGITGAMQRATWTLDKKDVADAAFRMQRVNLLVTVALDMDSMLVSRLITGRRGLMVT
jgi:hypothetical protein